MNFNPQQELMQFVLLAQGRYRNNYENDCYKTANPRLLARWYLVQSSPVIRRRFIEVIQLNSQTIQLGETYLDIVSREHCPELLTPLKERILTLLQEEDLVSGAIANFSFFTHNSLSDRARTRLHSLLWDKSIPELLQYYGPDAQSVIDPILVAQLANEEKCSTYQFKVLETWLEVMPNTLRPAIVKIMILKLRQLQRSNLGQQLSDVRWLIKKSSQRTLDIPELEKDLNDFQNRLLAS